MMKIFEVGTTDYRTNGLGQVLPLKCIETKKENFNGWSVDVEMSLDYQALIATNRVVTVLTKEMGEQAFIIDNPQFDKKIKFTANHVVFTGVNYILDDVRPTNLTCGPYLEYINSRVDVDSPFTVSSDICGNEQTNYFIRENLLDAITTAAEVFEGSIVVDNYHIHLTNNINELASYAFVYGKNIQGLTINEKWDDVITKIMPVGTDGLLLPEQYLEADINYGVPYTKIVDFTLTTKDDDDVAVSEEVQQEELRELATEYLEQNKEPLLNYVVSADVPQDIAIGYVIPVKHPLVELKTEVMSYTYDCVGKKVKTVEFGNYERSAKAEFSNFKNSITADVEKLVASTSNFLSEAKGEVEHLMNTSGANGFVHFKKDDDGTIKEIYFMDTASVEEAKTIIRINNQGIAGSTNGINGPYNSAMMADGTIVADMIKAGILQGVEIIAEKGTVAGWGVSNEQGLYSSYTRTLPTYTDADKTKISQYIMGETTLTDAEYERLDTTGDGVITSADYIRLVQLLNGTASSTQKFSYEINPENPLSFIKETIVSGSTTTVNECSIGAISKAAMREIREDIILIKNHLGI